MRPDALRGPAAPAVLALIVLLGAAAPAVPAVLGLTPLVDSIYEIDLTGGITVPTVPLSEEVFPLGVTLSASGELLAFTDADELVAVDVGTGLVSSVASFDLGVDESPLGLAEDACGRLFLATIDVEADLIRIRLLDRDAGTSVLTASVQPVALISPLAARGRHLYMVGVVPPATQVGVLRIDPDSGTVIQLPGDPLLASRIAGLDFAPDGHLWLNYPFPPILPPPPPPVQRIDIVTGAVTDFPNQYGLAPFAIAPAGGTCGTAPLPIPTVSTVGLGLLALLLAAAGAVTLTLRRAG